MCGSLGNVIDDSLYITLMELLEVHEQKQEKANNNTSYRQSRCMIPATFVI